MSTVQRIAKNTALLTAGDFISFVLGFFFTMYVARYLGAEGFGVLSFALAFTAIFGVFTDIGLQQLMIREIARDKALAPKYLGNIAVVKISLVLITFGLIALVINLLDYPQDTIKVVYLLSLSLVFNAFCIMFYGVFRAYERMEFAALGQVLTSALTLAGGFWAINHDFSVTGFALIYFLVSIITLVYSFAISSWKFLVPRIEVDFNFWKQALKQTWPFALVGAFGTIYLYIDSVMLSLIKGDEAVGWYNAAYRLILLLSFVPVAYFGAVFPSMSRFHLTSKDFLTFTHERSLKYMLILGVPICVGGTILADKVILLIFGGEYYPSIIALRILIWSTVFAFIGGVFANLFQSVNKQTIIAWVLGIPTVVKVVLNLILIPEYSYKGVSIATVVTGFIALALGFFWSYRIGYSIPIKALSSTIVRVSFASAIMFVPIMYFKNFYILALVPLSALLYFVVLYIIGGIDKEDKLLLRQILGKRLT